jgi:hypothetical protein
MRRNLATALDVVRSAPWRMEQPDSCNSSCARRDLLDDLGGDRLGAEAKALLKRKG